MSEVNNNNGQDIVHGQGLEQGQGLGQGQGPGLEQGQGHDTSPVPHHAFPALRLSSKVKIQHTLSGKDGHLSGRLGSGRLPLSGRDGGLLSSLSRRRGNSSSSSSNRGEHSSLLIPSHLLNEGHPSTSTSASHSHRHDDPSSRKPSVVFDVISTKVSFKDSELLSSSQESRRLSNAQLVIDGWTADHPNANHQAVNGALDQDGNNADNNNNNNTLEGTTGGDVREDIREGMSRGRIDGMGEGTSGSPPRQTTYISPRPATTGNSSPNNASPNNNNHHHNNNNNNNLLDHQFTTTEGSNLPSSPFGHRQLVSQGSATAVPPLHMASSSSRAQTAQGQGPARAPSKKSIDNTVR